LPASLVDEIVVPTKTNKPKKGGKSDQKGSISVSEDVLDDVREAREEAPWRTVEPASEDAYEDEQGCLEVREGTGMGARKR
jgi:hypothetical protein